ncbi:MAG: hypothetical protein Q4D55_05595 [Eubacteriales bacterium]|nr:hypothetical protein [Eubacteriales bacterium]
MAEQKELKELLDWIYHKTVQNLPKELQAQVIEADETLLRTWMDRFSSGREPEELGDELFVELCECTLVHDKLFFTQGLLTGLKFCCTLGSKVSQEYLDDIERCLRSLKDGAPGEKGSDV